MTVGEKLRMLRKQNGKMQREIAQVFNMTRQAISNYERGTRTPDLNTLHKLTRYYQITMDELFPEDTDPERDP